MPILSRTQQNTIYQIISKVGLDPSDFEWTAGSQRFGSDFEQLTHRPTGSYLKISLIQRDVWFDWWPDGRQGHRSYKAGGFDQADGLISEWAVAVRRNHDAPDLWGEVARARSLDQDPDRTDLKQPFTPDELRQLTSGLEDVERFVISQNPLPPEGQARVRRRFVYLLEAARAGARKIDWLNIFVSQMVSMVTEGLLTPQLYAPVMAHAATVLNAAIKLGQKLLGS